MPYLVIERTSLDGDGRWRAELLFAFGQHPPEGTTARNVERDGAVAEAVPSILWWALSDEKAWDIEGTAEQKAAFKRALSSSNKEGLTLLDQAVGVKRERFGRYLVRCADNWEFVFDLEDYFSAEEDQAALVLDLFAISNKLVASSKRPRGLMVASEISDAPSPLRAPIEKKVRRK